MFHTEDVVHRCYYLAHIFMSFLMAVATEHAEHHFFNFEYQACHSCCVENNIRLHTNNVCSSARLLAPSPRPSGLPLPQCSRAP